jgi:agmatinase
MRGAALAPPKIRQSLYCEATNLASELGIDMQDISLTDLGDHRIADSEEAYLAIEDIITPHVKSGARPLLLGGDHSITYPAVRALHKHHGPLTILHFDAHPDLYAHYRGNRFSHACPFARVMEEIKPCRLVQVGIRTLNSHQAEQAKFFQVEMHQMKDVCYRPFQLTITTPLYISFDMDVLDPAYAPGVSHPEPGGMSVREVLQIIQNLECSVIGADIVEYNPNRDLQGITAKVAAKLLKEIAAKMIV